MERRKSGNHTKMITNTCPECNSFSMKKSKFKKGILICRLCNTMAKEEDCVVNMEKCHICHSKYIMPDFEDACWECWCKEMDKQKEDENAIEIHKETLQSNDVKVYGV